ncbi:hypothetical protein LCGC14_0403990 [marine sediment metagenome]|uniref:Uncharacterized protein n=1 Tax=marine sediment metagenome TaxID=412755 RepID=A0A0F9SVX6_9ZZZZ
MKPFNDWYKKNYGEIPMDKNSKPMPSSRRNDKIPIQFTKLSPNDISIHKEYYVYLLLRDMKHTLGERGKELHGAMQLFYKTFK